MKKEKKEINKKLLISRRFCVIFFQKALERSEVSTTLPCTSDNRQKRSGMCKLLMLYLAIAFISGHPLPPPYCNICTNSV